MNNNIGKTKSVGFQFGIRKTVPASAEKVWEFLFSEAGTNIWLGKLKNELELKKEFETLERVTGYVRVFTPNSHIRLNWKPKHWENTSTIQIRIISKGDQTTIAIHQEKLLNTQQRNEMKAYWTTKINELTSNLK